MATKKNPVPPIVVIYGDDEAQKRKLLVKQLAELLPKDVEPALVLAEYDGDASEEQGGPTWQRVAEDLLTLPFLADRRLVVVRDADKFISAAREKLEAYLARPAPTGVLILTCRSFPKTTRLHRIANETGGRVHECTKLKGRALAEFVVQAARERGKRLDAGLAAQLIDHVGAEPGLLENEVEKMCLYAGPREQLRPQDLADLVGQTREEKIFAVMDAAGAGQVSEALAMWQQVLATDPAAVFRVVGGVAFVLRKWLAAHEMLAQGATPREIAPKVNMWGREQELAALLRRISATRTRRLLAGLARLDAQAKSGLRSIETGVEQLLLEVAGAAA